MNTQFTTIEIREGCAPLWNNVECMTCSRLLTYIKSLLTKQENWPETATTVAKMFPDFGWPERLSFSEAIAEQLVQMTRIVERDERDIVQTLITALQAAAEEKDRDAYQMDMWVDQSRNGGWSTHQVEAQRKLAGILRQEAAGIRRTIARVVERMERDG